MKVLHVLLLVLFIIKPFYVNGQVDCDVMKFGYAKMKVCKLSLLKSFNQDSIAKAHLGLRERLILYTVPTDSLLKANVFLYQLPNLGDNSVVISSSKQSKKSRVIYVVHTDYSSSYISYKNGIRQGGSSVYFSKLILKESGRYKKGLQNGYWRYWDENGDILTIKKFRRGIEHRLYEGKKLKSLGLFRFGPTIKYGLQTIETENLNRAIREYFSNANEISIIRPTFNYGIEAGNSNSLTILAYQRILFGSSVNKMQLNLITYGGKVFYTWFQTKKVNFRLGAGAESGRFYFKNATEILAPNNEYLSNLVIKNNNAVNLDFSFQVMSRRFPFKRKTNRDLFFSGLEFGYVAPISNGIYNDINNQTLNFSSTPISFKGFHFSIFIFVPSF